MATGWRPTSTFVSSSDKSKGMRQAHIFKLKGGKIRRVLGCDADGPPRGNPTLQTCGSHHLWAARGFPQKIYADTRRPAEGSLDGHHPHEQHLKAMEMNALLNAVNHAGKAEVGAVVGKSMGESPD